MDSSFLSTKVEHPLAPMDDPKQSFKMEQWSDYGIPVFKQDEQNEYIDMEHSEHDDHNTNDIAEVYQEPPCLTVAEVKRLIFTVTQIMSCVLENEGIPSQHWLAGLKIDLDGTFYDDLIVEMIGNLVESQAFTNAESKLLFTYVKRSLFVVAEQILKERELKRKCQWWKRARNYLSDVVVPNVVSTATSKVTIAIVLAVGSVGIGKRALSSI